MTYLFSVLPSTNSDFIKRLGQILFKFIWNDKSDKIKREVLYCNKEDGGLKMINVSQFINALKIARVKKFLDDGNKACWKILFSSELF